MRLFGFRDEIVQDISEVVVSACSSLFEMYAALHSKRCRYRDVDFIEYLVHNAGFHHVRFMTLCTLLPQCKLDDGNPVKLSKEIFKKVSWQSIIRGNKFHMLMFHLARAKTSVGANLNTIDTQDSESCHKDFVKRPHQVSSYLIRWFVC